MVYVKILNVLLPSLLLVGGGVIILELCFMNKIWETSLVNILESKISKWILSNLNDSCACLLLEKSGQTVFLWSR